MSDTRTFRTLNSTYEVDEANHMIRRVTGVNSPTSNQGTDGEWQPYSALEPQPSGRVLIVFDAFRATLTSTVQS